MNKQILTVHIFSFLRGFGQIMLQGNALTGLLFMFGIGIGSFTMLLGAIVGSLASVVAAKYLRVDRADIEQGLYGFNGALIGIAMLFFYMPSIGSFSLIVLGGMFSSVVMDDMLEDKGPIPTYTAPFIISAWFILFFASLFHLPVASVANMSMADSQLQAIIRGIGQIMFQANWLVGAIFIVALACHSRQALVFALIGSGVGLLVARIIGYPDELIILGLYSFNASLTAIALAAKFGIKPLPIVAGLLLSVLLTRIFQLFEVPALTAPFVLACWFVILTSSYYASVHVTSVIAKKAIEAK